MPNKRVTTKQRKRVIERARGCCEYCRSQLDYATQSFSVEHIAPRTRGGKTELDNLAFACQGCNGHKYTKTAGYDSVSNQFAPLYHPRQQKWRNHFRWNNDFSLIVGVTPTGRATVDTLQLNRHGVQNLRHVLYAMGKHPVTEHDDL